MLGPLDGERAAAVFALPGSLTATGGSATAAGPAGDPLADRVLRLPADPDDPAWFADARRRLLEARNRRPQPARDDLVVLRSNGLAIAGLADAGASSAGWTGSPPPRRAADYLVRVHRDGQRWTRSSRDGRVGPGPAVLADHGDLARGCSRCSRRPATPGGCWRPRPSSTSPWSCSRTAPGGFVDTSRRRRRSAGAAAWTRRTAPRRPGSRRVSARAARRRRADRRAGVQAGGGCRGGERRLAGRAVPSIRRLAPRRRGGRALGSVADRDRGDLAGSRPAGPDRRRTRACPPPAACSTSARRTSRAIRCSPNGRCFGGRAAAYVCRGFVCDRPVSDAASLRDLLSRKVLSGESLAPS